MSQFYALMSDNTVKHISLKEEIVTEIKNIFINVSIRINTRCFSCSYVRPLHQQ